MALLYGAGAAVGFSPQQVNEMSLWQFTATLQGYARLRATGTPKLSESEKDELFEWLSSAGAAAPEAPKAIVGFDDELQVVLIPRD